MHISTIFARLTMAVCIVALPGPLWSADNVSTNVGNSGNAVTTTVIVGEPRALDEKLVLSVLSGSLAQHDGAKLVDGTVCTDSHCSADRGTYVLINVINWSALPKTTSNWFVFRGGQGKLSEEDFNGGTRLYGAKRTLLLSIQITPRNPASPNTHQTYLPANTPTYTVTETKRTPTNFQHLGDLFGVIAPSKESGAKGGGANETRVFWTGGTILRKYATADLTISTAVPQPHSATPVQDPGNSPAQPASEPAATTNPDSNNESAPPRPNSSRPPIPRPTPGDAEAPAHTVDSSSNASGSAESGNSVSMPDYNITDESKSYWDISVAVPVNKVSALQYNSANNTVTTSEVNRQSVFAVADLFFPPKDLVGLKYSFIPHPLVGVSMASKPLHSLLFGGGIGLSLGELYAGANLLKQQKVAGLTAGSTATPQQLAAASSQVFQTHFMIGINISVKTAFGAAANKGK